MGLLSILLPCVSNAESVEDIRTAYETMRRDGFIKVHEEYVTKLKAVQTAYLKSQRLDAANAIQPEIEQSTARIGLFREGKDPEVPGLIPSAGESGDGSVEVAEGIKSREAADLRREFVDRLRRGLATINEIYFQKSSEAQKAKLAAADLAGANAFEALKLELKAESDALSGKTALPSGGASSAAMKGDYLLSEQNRKRWIVVSGDWEFKDDSLVGSGDCEIKYAKEIRAPFVLTFDFEVKKGMRPRIYVGKDLKIANEGYKNQLALYPVAGKEEPVPYEIGKKHSVKFVANRRYLEFYLNDKLVTRRETGIEEKIESIGFLGGDGFSPGVTHFSNIRIE